MYTNVKNWYNIYVTFCRKQMLFPIWAQKLALLGADVRTEEDVRQIRGLMLMMKSFREKYTELMQYKMAKVAMYIKWVL